MMISFDGTVRPATAEEIDAIEALRAASATANGPSGHEVRKLLIVDRIGEEKYDDFAGAIALLPAFQRARWEAAIRIASDDADARALLTAIGLDPDVILAPDPEI